VQVIEKLSGEVVLLILAMMPGKVLRMKPQNDSGRAVESWCAEVITSTMATS
jgi:hypothetical protein